MKNWAKYLLFIAFVTHCFLDSTNASELLDEKFFEECENDVDADVCDSAGLCSDTTTFETCEAIMQAGDSELHIQFYKLCFCCQLRYCASNCAFFNTC